MGCGWLDQMILHFRVILNAMYDKCIWCPKTFFLLCMKIRFFLLPHHLEKVFVSVVCSRYCFNWSFILLLQAVMIPSSSGETTKHFTLVKPRYQAHDFAHVWQGAVEMCYQQPLKTAGSQNNTQVDFITLKAARKTWMLWTCLCSLILVWTSFCCWPRVKTFGSILLFISKKEGKYFFPLCSVAVLVFVLL